MNKYTTTSTGLRHYSTYTTITKPCDYAYGTITKNVNNNNY